MPKLLEFSPALQNMPLQFEFGSDFPNFATGTDGWTSLAADTGATVATVAGSYGIVALGTGTTDNNEASLSTTNALFKFNATDALVFEGRLQYAEANTSAANVAFGLSSTFGANLLVDDGAGVTSSFSGVLFYKVDGGTVWRVKSSIGTTNTDTVLVTTAGGSSYSKFRIECVPISLTRVEITYFIDDAEVLDPNAGYKKQLLHTLDATSAAAMKIGAYVKEGSASAETLNVDYLYAMQRRS
jgi:hypothetical protein